MKTLLSLICWTAAFSLQAQTYTEKLETERMANNLEMLMEVLDSAERKTFEGICYFPVDTSYIVDATFTRKKGKKFAMPMTKARTVYYRQYGTLTFRIHDTVCQLNVYENLALKGSKAHKNYLFLPFRDGTTAISTYGGGRYLDIEKSKSKTWKIDFNKAYHPYCVYSHRYSCPIPPAENTVAPFINAGECYVSHE
jgi:uncharacterized protein (DUF1684 family)